MTMQADKLEFIMSPLGLAASWLLTRAAERLHRGSLCLVFPDGRQDFFCGAEPGPSAILEIRSWRMLLRLKSGGAGFAEGYLAGEWDTPDLAALLLLLAQNLEQISLRVKRPWRRWQRHIEDLRRGNDREGSRRNIAEHYDLGNDFYRHWLDESMTYSAAVFEYQDQPLELAQAAKFRRIATLAALAPGQHVLEIGCGWGGFARWAAREIGCRMTAITISPAQHAHAAAAIQADGLGDRIDLRLQDYRDARGSFDRIVSIEMLEAVGWRYWPHYFAQLHDRLRSGGRAAIQTITIAPGTFDRYRGGVDFIQKHIFPGGMLPSVPVLRQEVNRAGLRWDSEVGYGLHYAETLHRWRHRFEDTWHLLQRPDLDERFRRLWRFYLCYCEAGFRTGRLDVNHIALVKP
jgi:cyclopropane-fatty-acyl-phospholipid synthase